MNRVAHVLRKLEAAAWGGTETHVAEMSSRLEGWGWSPEVHAPRAGEEGPPPGLAGIEVKRFRAFAPFVASPRAMRDLRANGGNIASLEAIVKLAVDRHVALAHVHTCGRIGGAVRTAMRLTGRPYVVSLHGPVLSAASFLSGEVSRRRHGVIDLGRPLGWMLGARRVLDDAARVISFNDEEHEALKARIGHRAVRMDHGVDVIRLRTGDPARAEARWPRLGRSSVVLVLGRLCEQKNQLLAVRAFAGAATREHRLVMAGAETDAGYAGRIMREASALGVADRVHLLGNVPRSDVPDLIARAEVVLTPSLHEAFGLVVLEAWAASRPVLFARLHGLADIARAVDHDAASVPSHDAGEWVSALRSLLATGAARAANVARGSVLVNRRYSWDQAAASLASLYDDVVDEQAVRRVGT